jgi:EpsI family protein
MMSFKHTLTASALMILTMVLLNYLNHKENIYPNKPFSTFPKHIGEWVGEEYRFEADIYDVLGVDDSFLGSYKTSDGRQVELYIGFYQNQREGDLIHSPKNCMPGGGWNIVHTSLEEIKTPGTNPENYKVIKLMLQKGAQKQVVLYWFQSRGRIINSEYMQKIYLVVDSMMRHRTDGSFVRLIAPVLNGDENKALNTLKDFAVQLMPILYEYIPS